MKKLLYTALGFVLTASLHAQPDRWQQRVDYKMDIFMDVDKHRYNGRQQLLYTNNSPDTLHRLFYHLYFNAFQPGSMMNVRALNQEDADSRLSEKISKLTPEEQGFIQVKTLTCNGIPVTFETSETILEVTLPKPVNPGATATLEMTWDAQVPKQTRRSGRDSQEGVAYSMSQWYPKLCEYDYQGWHANPYIAREFYGVWGDFDVTIHIDNRYVVAAGGVLQNPEEMGHGYSKGGSVQSTTPGKQLSWHFKAQNVHDFVWAADPEFTQKVLKADDGTIMRFFWKKGKGYDEQWEALPAIMNRARNLMNERFGKYPYPEYAFIQGGDGGMEYPMATLMTGDRPIESLVGVAVHEHLHAWYQGVLGTNESLYAWMDEGFTSYAQGIIENELAREGLMGERKAVENPHFGSNFGYAILVNSRKEEPLTTHADHFHTNKAYNLAAYTKGAVFLNQLGYVIGEDNLAKGLLRYFDTWKFKHPNANDFIRVMEKQSGLELDWYKEDFVHTTNTIDYSIASVELAERDVTRITINRLGDMAMPLDVMVTYDDGRQELFYAPLESMRGAKPAESELPRTVLPDHRWVDPQYIFTIERKWKKIKSVEIDPSQRMVDAQRSNNVWKP